MQAQSCPSLCRHPHAARTIVALSRLVPRKGIDLLADVVPAMGRRRPDLHFVIGAHALVTLSYAL